LFNAAGFTTKMPPDVEEGKALKQSSRNFSTIFARVHHSLIINANNLKRRKVDTI
jgi:hypothetical protein